MYFGIILGDHEDHLPDARKPHFIVSDVIHVDDSDGASIDRNTDARSGNLMPRICFSIENTSQSHMNFATPLTQIDRSWKRVLSCREDYPTKHFRPISLAQGDGDSTQLLKFMLGVQNLKGKFLDSP